MGGSTVAPAPRRFVAVLPREEGTGVTLRRRRVWSSGAWFRTSLGCQRWVAETTVVLRFVW